MNKRFRRGLVVGKFCPLHRGHEKVIRRMIESCDEASILSYTRPEFPECEPEKRRRWLTSIFPEARVLVLEQGAGSDGVEIPANDADETVHRRFSGQICRERLGGTVDAVFTSEDYGEGFAEELTRLFREDDPRHPRVEHVMVDRLRTEHPVSGTALRADIHSLREWVSPIVYADFVERVCIFGGESSGKSTLAIALAEYIKTAHVAEYGRELWEAQDGKLEFDDLLRIGETQVAREEAACRKANRYLFCDTSPLTTLFYSLAMFGKVAPRLVELAQRDYARYVLCAPDIPFVQDGTRQDEDFRTRQHDWYVEKLSQCGRPWIEVSGTVSERVRQVGAWLNGKRHQA